MVPQRCLLAHFEATFYYSRSECNYLPPIVHCDYIVHLPITWSSSSDTYKKIYMVQLTNNINCNLDHVYLNKNKSLKWITLNSYLHMKQIMLNSWNLRVHVNKKNKLMFFLQEHHRWPNASKSTRVAHVGCYHLFMLKMNAILANGFEGRLANFTDTLYLLHYHVCQLKIKTLHRQMLVKLEIDSISARRADWELRVGTMKNITVTVLVSAWYCTFKSFIWPLKFRYFLYLLILRVCSTIWSVKIISRTTFILTLKIHHPLSNKLSSHIISPQEENIRWILRENNLEECPASKRAD